MKKIILFFILSTLIFITLFYNGCSSEPIEVTTTKKTTTTLAWDKTPPEWVSGYPKIEGITSSSFTLKANINESGIIYYILVVNNASAPTSAQVKSQSNYGSVTLIAKDFVNISANSEASLPVVGLSENTEYDLYIVAEDANFNIMVQPTKIDIKTTGSDSTPPEWVSGYPSVANIGSNSFDLKVKINESGKVYYAVLNDGASAPTAAQVKAGTGFVKAGNSSVIANTEYIFSITGLTANTNYDVYAVAEDNASNLMTTVSNRIDVTTLASDTTPPEWGSGYPMMEDITRTSLTLKVKINESGKVYYIVVDKGSTSPTSSQVKAGVNYGSVVVRKSGNTTVSGNVEEPFNITDLEETKEYDIYAVAEDNVPNIQTIPTKKTLNITPSPEWDLATDSRTTSQKIALSVSGGGTITYTTNGSDPDGIPDANELTYSTPISISTAITLKFIAKKTDCKPSSIQSQNFPLAIGEHYPRSGSFSKVNESGWATATWNLGANYNGSDVEFAVYSKNATRILLEIYDTETSSTNTNKAFGEDARYEYWMAKGSDNIWRAKLANVPQKTYYAFRCWGPNWTFSTNWKRGNSAEGFIIDVDTDGNRFNPNKVLFDPYTKEISHDKSNPTALGSDNGAIYGTGGSDTSSDHVYSGPATGGTPMNRRNIDTGKYAPKGIIFTDSTGFGTKPEIAQKDAIIYESHVRGLTMHESSTSLASILSGFNGFSGIQNVPAEYRGTYKGASYMAKYLKGLGINTIELLPVHETDNDNNPSDHSGGNYWGYMTYGYFAPDRRYSSDKSPGGPTKEFKEMVAAFHAEGIEVYLDVVYNHSGEGGIWDSTTRCAELTFFRGFDNSEYYCLVPSTKNYYWETTGCGNNLRCDNPPVTNLVKDSLKYWIQDMGVDGFRFDLAPVLGRVFNGTNWNFQSDASLLTDIANMTGTYNVEMIAEAWDLGTYQVGNFPNKWGEWNGRYRDQVRKFLKGDGNTTGSDSDPKFIQVFNGDYGYFNDQGGPHKSVNFIVAHDGFTLTDLVSYNNKNNNVVWPFGPSDGGTDNNDSWNSDLSQSLRRQRVRNFFTVQMFSRGVPMIVYGDEFGRTQNGNNNSYNVDGLGTYNNYNMINTDSPNAVTGGYHNNLGTDTNNDSKNALFLFAQYVMNLRKSHVSLRQSDYSVTYTFKKEDGTTNLSDGDRCVWIRIDGSSAGDCDFLVFVNMWTSQVNYTIPAPDSGKKWVRIIDTADWAEYNVGASAYNNFWELTDPSAYSVTSSTPYGVNGWSVVVFQEANN